MWFRLSTTSFSRRFSTVVLGLLFGNSTWGQSSWQAEVSGFMGAILPHNKQIAHLITEKPTGFLVSLSKPLEGHAFWQQHYNAPEIGISVHYQDNHNAELGNLIGLYAHYDFYFLKRALQLRVAQGVAYATHPYDHRTHFRNMAYGSHFMPSTYFRVSYEQRKLWRNWGFTAGLLFAHHSNASIQSPNMSTNTVALSTGVLYTSSEKKEQFIASGPKVLDQRIAFSTVFRAGVNESHIIGMGQKPFYHFSVMGTKRLGYTSSVQAGTELFLSYTVKEMIPFLAQSFPEFEINPRSDWKRIGVFLGYEMHLNKLSAEGQLGYYLYDHYQQNGSTYQRLGLRYYVTSQLFAAMSLKTHLSKAEAFEVGLGIKL